VFVERRALVEDDDWDVGEEDAVDQVQESHLLARRLRRTVLS
jgi:hypothetical protein